MTALAPWALFSVTGILAVVGLYFWAVSSRSRAPHVRRAMALVLTLVGGLFAFVINAGFFSDLWRVVSSLPSTPLNRVVTLIDSSGRAHLLASVLLVILFLGALAFSIIGAIRNWNADLSAYADSIAPKASSTTRQLKNGAAK